nr:MAG TPA: hypothetical protein [Caudoviricetes sp.]
MEIIKLINTTETVTVETKYGNFVVPYDFICDDPVYVALEPYGKYSDVDSDYDFSVMLLTGDDHEYDTVWLSDYDDLEVAVIRLTKEEVGGEPDSKEYHDFIINSLCKVTPRRNTN